MTQYEPSRILENPDRGVEDETMQQYVEIGSNTYLGTKDGIKYALYSTSDNKYKLCEIPSESNLNTTNSKSISWSSSYGEECTMDSDTTPTSGCKAIKLIGVRKESSVCKGQGDESGNSIVSTPDSTSRFKNAENNTPRQVLNVLEESQILFEDKACLTYTTLLPKQERASEQGTIYTLPQHTFFQVPQVQFTPVSSRPTRFIKHRQRMQLFAGSNSPYSSPPIISTRGHRQRRPRQVWYQYRAPLLHSTPTSIPSLCSNTSSTPPMLMDSSRSSSISNSSESQISLEYPRVPNNTPNSEEDLVGKHKVLDLQQWIPQLHSRIENFAQLDPRESHNEKERKRRLRIKNACQNMKGLLPCVCDKTDNATVFENAVHYIAFMRQSVGIDYDMEFLEQTCEY